MRWVKKPIAAQMKRAQTNMTYVVDGNKCANKVPQGQYFQLINSTIAGRSDGIYTASKAIPANYVIDNAYFSQTTPIAEGAINKINGELTSLNSNLVNLDDKVSKRIVLSSAAWSGKTVSYTIPRNGKIYRFTAMNPTGTLCCALILMRSDYIQITNLTSNNVAQSYSSNTLTLTLPSDAYWECYMECLNSTHLANA